MPCPLSWFSGIPAHPGKMFSKNAMGWIEFTSVFAAAALDSMVAASKYFVLLVGSVKLMGMAKSTCIGRRLAIVPTYATCSEERDENWRDKERLNAWV